jgi:hypothetical protein
MAGFKRLNKKEQSLYVTPHTIPTDSAGWKFGGKAWKSDNSQKMAADDQRKVMQVRPLGDQFGAESVFLIDIPKSFFDQDPTSDSYGEFIATPAYQQGDKLLILWTGTNKPEESGWIDLNISERGAGGASTVTSRGGCAKWS